MRCDRTWFASRDDVPRCVVASESSQSVGRLVQVDAFQSQVFSVGHHRSCSRVPHDSAFNRRHGTGCFMEMANNDAMFFPFLPVKREERIRFYKDLHKHWGGL